MPHRKHLTTSTVNERSQVENKNIRGDQIKTRDRHEQAEETKDQMQAHKELAPVVEELKLLKQQMISRKPTSMTQRLKSWMNQKLLEGLALEKESETAR